MHFTPSVILEDSVFKLCTPGKAKGPRYSPEGFLPPSYSMKKNN